jgi:peptidoglycan hydrolase-like protein with peptidoglycan-binding domain
MASIPTGKYLQALSAGVGTGQPNTKHDTALVQAALRLILDAKGKPFYAGTIDGSFGNGTTGSITRFQGEKMKGTTIPASDAGKVLAGSATETALRTELPRDIRLGALPGSKVVYRAADGIDLSNANAAVAREPNLQPGFLKSLGDLNDRFWDGDKLVLGVATKGGFRSFQTQFDLPPTTTKAGPGESNHNFGNGCDFGFIGFRFLSAGGAWQDDDFWLNALAKLGLSKPFWDRRNSYFPGLNLFPSALRGDLIHIQAFDDNHVSMRKSLADLMTRVGPNCDWDHDLHQYQANLIFADTKFPVGSSKQIWSGSAPVTAANLASALEAGRTKRNTATGSTLTADQETKYVQFAGATRPTTKAWTAREITNAQLTLMRNFLREDMRAAETGRAQWRRIE